MSHFGNQFWSDQLKQSLRLHAVAAEFSFETILSSNDEDRWHILVIARIAIKKRLGNELSILGGMAGEW